MDAAQYARIIGLAVHAIDALTAARGDAQSRPDTRTFTAADAAAYTRASAFWDAFNAEHSRTDAELALDRSQHADVTMARQLRLPEADEKAQAQTSVEGGRERFGVSTPNEPEQPR
jgi:hypothetical protein